ncbi:hypothetical protein HK096_002825, partial [Nowakowskiella sp. JEL0078]
YNNTYDEWLSADQLQGAIKLLEENTDLNNLKIAGTRGGVLNQGIHNARDHCDRERDIFIN